MFAHLADPGVPRPWLLPDRHGRGQLSECVHLPDSLAEKRDLARFALPELSTAPIAARDNIPIVSWFALRGRMPQLRRFRSRCGTRWSKPWSACCFSGLIWST